MKKFESLGRSLSKLEQKSLLGGVAASPCDSCTQLCHANDDGSYGWNMCPSNTGGTSCHNYCCSNPNATYWC